jgi:predicted DNA-binding transcriptional regulator YafY
MERVFWFDGELKRQRYPNAARLAEKFEVSGKTAQRDIALLRDRLLAPIEYDFSRKGYYYTADHFELPYLPASQHEVLCLIAARQLLQHAAGGFISRELDSLSEKLFDSAGEVGLDPVTVARAFSATWSGYTPAHEEVFRQIAWALVKRRLIAFTYRSPQTDAITLRTAEPHHLQHYMASWVLTAWCRHRRAWRKFYLARMTELTILDTTFKPRPEELWRPLLQSVFGLFQSAEPTLVTLRFCPFRARWIRQQHWHPDQILTELPDGCLELTLPVADFREIKMLILQFGADCEVVSPAALLDEIQAEIERMAIVYRRKA